jgi:osmotically-inducible protein OsmY
MELNSYFRERPPLLWLTGFLVFCVLLATSISIGYLEAVHASVEVRTYPADTHVTQRIRDSVRRNKSLSSQARNVQIVAQGGKVTLRGLVQSEDERNAFQAEAVAVVGNRNVSNQIEIALSQ